MKKNVLFLAVAAVSLSYGVSVSLATPTIAKQTGKQCTDCHGTSDSGSGSGGPHAKGPGGTRTK